MTPDGLPRGPVAVLPLWLRGESAAWSAWSPGPFGSERGAGAASDAGTDMGVDAIRPGTPRGRPGPVAVLGAGAVRRSEWRTTKG